MLDTILATMRFGGGMWFPLIPFLFFLFWVGVAVFFGRRWRREPRRSGEEILAERYARGEITEEEYRERREVLRRR
ncbi:MAG: SHOCT domain-containing protein [Actinomycetes bacterium]|jgi:putative membrane protein|nr:SHOCT domain-containing protein [Acidimicrobiia bacterium]